MPEAIADEPHRPGAVLFVYSWDMLLSIFALFGVLTPFAGGLAAASGTVKLAVGWQILGAVAYASYAATLIIIASLLTRRRTWVRRMQIVTLGTTIALAVVSLIVDYAIGVRVELYALLGVVLFGLVDALAILVMTERRIVDWYNEASKAPAYVVGTLCVWAVGSCVTVALGAVLR